MKSLFLCSVMWRKFKSSVGRFKRLSFIYWKRCKPMKFVLFLTRTVSQGVVAVAMYFITSPSFPIVYWFGVLHT